MKVVIYPGCMVLARFQDYELASRKVLETLGCEIANMHEFCCCGASLLPGVTGNWVNLSAYNLALAEKAGAHIITLCGNCTNNFKRTNLYFERDPEIRRKIRATLSKLGLDYSGKVKIYHLIEIFDQRLRDIQELVKSKLKLKVALTHPCQVFRPKEITGIQDDPVEPKNMRQIVESLGCEVIEYDGEYECCGATALLFDEELAISHGRARLEAVKASGADVVCVACGNSFFLLDRYQDKMGLVNPESKIPVVSLSQLAGLSLGCSEESSQTILRGSLSLG